MELVLGQFGFVRWWAVLIPQRIWLWGKRVIWLVGDAFAVQAMVTHWGQAIFQDPTWQGRIIGILIRTVRIVIGLFAQGITVLLVIAALAAWYLFPLVALFKVIV